MVTDEDEEEMEININEQTIRAPKKDQDSSSDGDGGPAYHVCDNEPFYDPGTSQDEDNCQANETQELNAEAMPSAGKFSIQEHSIENLSKIEMLSSFQGSIEKSKDLYGNLKDRVSLQNSLELEYFLVNQSQDKNQ